MPRLRIHLVRDRMTLVARHPRQERLQKIRILLLPATDTAEETDLPGSNVMSFDLPF